MIQPLKNKNPTASLRRFMSEIGPMQFVREIYMNSKEADASKMKVYFDHQFLKGGGPKKLCFSDDGKGMTADEMYEYLAHLNSSSKRTGGLHDNFGIGVKTTTLLANPYGVVFLSWSKNNPSGAMAWFVYDEVQDVVGLKPFEYIEKDEDGDQALMTLTTEMRDGSMANIASLDDLQDCHPNGFQGVKWWDCKKQSGIKNHGTIVMLLGKSRDEDSVGADWSDRTLNYYFITRFLNLKLEVHCSGMTTRKPRGLLDALGKSKWEKDQVKLNNGFIVEVHYMEKRDVKAWQSNGSRNKIPTVIRKGYSAIEYKNELYHSAYGRDEMRSWGVSHEDVMTRILLIIKPPEYGMQKDGVERGCYPNEKRNALLWADETIETENRALDLREVKMEFIEKQPELLKKWIKEAYEADQSEFKVDTSTLRNEWRKLFNARRSHQGVDMKAAHDGELKPDSVRPSLAGIWTPPSVPAAPEPAPRPPRRAKEQNAKTDHPVEITFPSEAEEDYSSSGVTLPVKVSLGNPIVIMVNLNFSTFIDLKRFILNKFKPTSIEALDHDYEKALQKIMVNDLDMFALHFHAQRRKHELFKTYNNEDLQRALAIRLLGSAWWIGPKLEQALTRRGHKRLS
jgi:hypothetical protein